LAIATENGQPIALGHAHLGVGIHAHSKGTLPAALEAYEQSGAIFRRIGHIRGWGGATMMQAWIYEDRGDFERALALAEAVTAAGDDSADPQVRAWGLQRRGASRRQIGRINEALADLETAVALSTAIPDYAGIVQGLALIGLCHLDRGDPEKARRYVNDANRTCHERSLRGLWVAPAVMADAEVSIAELRAATPDNKRSVRRQAARASRAAERLGRDTPHHLPTALRLVGTMRWHEGRAAAAEKLWRRSAEAAEASGARYHEALAAAELGEFLGKPSELERAAAIFRQTGALRDLQRVERLLRTRTDGRSFFRRLHSRRVAVDSRFERRSPNLARRPDGLLSGQMPR
jgi:tetratricopeptide (TPR) repeat protein